ncbi:MAG: rhodanese-like domain-containing protein [Bacteroidetes bacterium]|nr:rhodanese-like domain-containing protein [Bacteroidota bacterium]
MGFLNNLFTKTDNTNVRELLANGAMVIDVRTPAEFSGGHVAGAKNIPLQIIDKELDRIKAMKQPIVLCCASGMRSGNATNYLKSKGVNCVNGGGWMQVNNMMP